MLLKFIKQVYNAQFEIPISLSMYTREFTYPPYFNTIFNTISSVRKRLCFPTIFNILGCLSNPLQPQYHVIGVYRQDLVPILAEVLQATGSIHALVLYSMDGIDELSVSSLTYIAEIQQHGIKTYTIDPQSLGFAKAHLSDIVGGNPTDNASIIQAIFSGNLHGAKLDTVILNAAAGLLVAGTASSWQDAIVMARNAISSGKTLELLNNLNKE